MRNKLATSIRIELVDIKSLSNRSHQKSIRPRERGLGGGGGGDPVAGLTGPSGVRCGRLAASLFRPAYNRGNCRWCLAKRNNKARGR